ncbi:hypothetical protein [Desulfocurvibacter africanus]|uniref:hypothetical protein n=1 Tax=Desulfocurvibacter africanus TaxID=873 RepID=UPI0004103D11|nr:hypothetical protein [Desulfocurvibacter africanus]
MTIIVQIRGPYGGWFDEINCPDMARAEREAADIVAHGERPEDVRIIAGEIRQAPACCEWDPELAGVAAYGQASGQAYGREEAGDEAYTRAKEAA